MIDFSQVKERYGTVDIYRRKYDVYIKLQVLSL